MSKLEEQKALPRRKLFKAFVMSDVVHSTGITINVPQPKRKAKKAKGKR